MKQHKILLIVSVLFISFSCRDKSPEIWKPEDQKFISTWSQAFDSFWNGMNYNYVFWDIDTTDWDQVYEKYSPRFDALGADFNDESATNEAIRLFTEITSTLVDHHFAITVKDSMIKTPLNEVKKRDYYHKGFDFADFNHFLEVNKASGRISNLEGGRSTSQEDLFVFSCKMDDIVYIHFNHFALTELLAAGDENDPAFQGLDNFFYMLKEETGLKGVIVDIRQNPGGNAADMNTFFGNLIATDHRFLELKTKNNVGRLDYSPWAPWTIHPQEESVKITAPIVSLADVGSASMAEITTLAIKTLPNGHFVGERTMGATGPLATPFELYYTGSFSNSIIKVRTSTMASRDLEGNSYEGIGITPDIEVRFDAEQYANGVDVQLERAIQYINTGK